MMVQLQRILCGNTKMIYGRINLEPMRGPTALQQDQSDWSLCILKPRDFC